MTFYIKTKNPWIIIISLITILIIYTSIFITYNTKTPSILINSIATQIVILAIIGFSPFLILYYLFQVLFSETIEINITENEISGKFQEGFFCIQEEKIIRKEDILKWKVINQKNWDTIKIKTNSGTYYIRALDLLFKQKSFREFENNFRHFVAN